jgi:predicted DNA-binding protein with PD1-like motif
MKARKFTGGYLVRIERGEEVTRTLTDFLLEKQIYAGTVTGIGGIGDAELGYYDLPSRTYLRKTIPGNLELVYYMGNITLMDGEPFIHAHTVVSGPDFNAYSGHFFSARIVATGEFVIHPADWEIARALDDETGLKLMDIPE